MSKRSAQMVHDVLSAHKRGELRLPSGQPVTSRRQAVAIALRMANRYEAPPRPVIPERLAQLLIELQKADLPLAQKLQFGRQQLDLFHDFTPAPSGHDWTFQGVVPGRSPYRRYRCSRCPAVKRWASGRGWSEVLYEIRPDELSRKEPPCQETSNGT